MLKMQKWYAWVIIMVFAGIVILDSRLIFMAWFGCLPGMYYVTMCILYKVRFFSVPLFFSFDFILVSLL